MADPRLQWRQISVAQPNTSGLLREMRGGINDAAAAAEGILGRYEEGQISKNDAEVANELAALDTQEEIDAYFANGGLAGRKVSDAMLQSLLGRQGDIVGFGNTRSQIRDRDGRLVIAQDLNARAGDLHGVAMEDHRFRQGRRAELAGLSDEVVAARLEGQQYGSAGVPQSGIQAQVYQGLLDRGMPEHIAQGFMMNFQDESGFNPGIEEAAPNVHGTRGRGLYQLTGSRREQFEAKYGNDYSIDNQLDFLMEELNTTERGAWDVIRNSQNAGEAGANIVNNFLRPAAEHARSRTAKYVGANGFDVEAASADVQRGTPARDILQTAVANSEFLSLEDVNSILNGNDDNIADGDARIAKELAQTQQDMLAAFVTDAVANPDNLTSAEVAAAVEEAALASGEFSNSEALDARKAAEALVAGSESLQTELAPTVAQDIETDRLISDTLADERRRFEGTDINRAISDIGTFAEDPTGNLESALGIPSDPETRGDYDSENLRRHVNRLAEEHNVEPAVMAVAMRDAFIRDPGDNGRWWDIDWTRNTIENRFDPEIIKQTIDQITPDSRALYDQGQSNLAIMEQQMQQVATQRDRLRTTLAKLPENSPRRAAIEAQMVALDAQLAAIQSNRSVRP